MFLDHAVIAGVMAVGLTMVIYSSVGLFIWRDSPRRLRR
ncbi:cytochrome c oxidase subunit CcoM [Pseudomonas graminis]|nr:cytochrome c oxidase subunit CcoM [Pseudomonas graminis]